MRREESHFDRVGFVLSVLFLKNVFPNAFSRYSMEHGVSGKQAGDSKSSAAKELPRPASGQGWQESPRLYPAQVDFQRSPAAVNFLSPTSLHATSAWLSY